jgi:two-component system sensor histidine kinase/response regulator
LLVVINDILDFSKIEAGRLEILRDPFDLNQLLKRLADLFCNRVAQKDLELTFSVAPQVPRQLIGDAGRLTQVLTNLIENAVKYTDAGKIAVSVDLDDGLAVMGDRAYQPTGRTVLKFLVCDTGIGIDADVLPTLFDPFTQADSYLTRKHEGTGLGLAICQRLVELMGGAIKAQSTPGEGSTFSFTAIVEIGKKDEPVACRMVDLKGLRVLVVDDDSIVREVMGDILEALNFNVLSVDSGVKAIEEIQRGADGEPYQLVLLDRNMPGMNGIETAMAIRNHRALPSKPFIILVTGAECELGNGRAAAAPVDAVLLKPVNISQLSDTIMALFNRPEAKKPEQAREPSDRMPHQLSGRRVLVVEDSEMNRVVTVALLEEIGMIVETAANGQIAVEMVTAVSRDSYDAVLMDIQMPVLDGYEACRRIREWETDSQAADHRIPIIAVTAHALKGEKEKCLAANMDDYLSKPINMEDLIRVLHRWIPS